MHPGATIAAAYFQPSTEAMFGYLDLLIYLDNFLRYAENTSSFLEKLCAVFHVCKGPGLNLNEANCNLVSEKVQF